MFVTFNKHHSMKKIFKIVQVQNDQLIMIGENYQSNIFPYPVVEKMVDNTFQLWQVDNPNDIDHKNQFEILAQYPNRLKDIPDLPITHKIPIAFIASIQPSGQLEIENNILKGDFIYDL
jgi:hypothetical protein